MGDKPVVFIIAQDAESRKLVHRALDGTGMAATEAESVQRAASQAKLSNPDIIVLDDRLGGADWYDVYTHLREELTHTFIPVLVLLEPAGAEAALARMESGLIDALVKPVHIPELKARLKAMYQVKVTHDQMDTERLALQQKLDEERRLREQLSSINEELKRLSTTDGLTGLANYRYMRNWLSTEYEIATRYKLPLSAIMLDLDNFKDVNDRYGHPFGDFVLKSVAHIVQGKSRRADFTARYGGDEFLVILPNTDGVAAANLAQRIHASLEKHPFDDERHHASVTASFGIASYPADGVSSPETLIDFADRALYSAKSKGRNRIITWREIQ